MRTPASWSLRTATSAGGPCVIRWSVASSDTPASCPADSTTVVGGFAGVPAGASINVWIAEEGYLVAWESAGFGAGDTSIQVTGIDDPANKVDRPS